jgi:saccharopine dehydrogenase-like NADP-dependent oxidoreductase
MSVSSSSERVESIKSDNGRVLILGATGRVGGSAARALVKSCPNVHLVLAGRNREKGAKLAAELGANTEFYQVSIDNAKALAAALDGVDLVVHAAGPFQREEKCTVLEAAISSKTAYIDVCDDRSYSCLAKTFHEKAVAAQVPAITTAGIYPGVSNSGSGGAGPTILATSFLLLGEEVIAYRKGEEFRAKPYSGVLDIDFGKGVGKRSVYLLNLPEVGSTHEVLGVPTVSARFGTAPFFWNWAMSAVVNLAPVEFLKDRNKVQTLVQLSDPLVRAIDIFSGELMSMRVDLECMDGRKAVGLYSHKKLSICVGVAISAFVRAVLEGNTQPGVWFPEEPEGIAVEARQQLLERAAEGTINFVMNRPPWMVETNPKEIGFGIYMQ